jgi:hypothetical protein
MASQPLIGYCLGPRPNAVEFFILAIQDYSEVIGIIFVHRKSRKTSRFRLSSTGIESILTYSLSVSTSPDDFRK